MKNFFYYFLGVSWEPLSDVFFFNLISTHDYIMFYLVLVISLVSWLLYIILKNFFWGEWLVSRSLLFKYFYILESFFLPFYVKYLKLFIATIYIVYFYVFYKIQYQIYEYMNQGFVDLLILPNIVEYFVWGKAFDKKHSEHASKSLYVAGFFCLLRGYYTWTYVKENCDPKNPDRIVPFWNFDASPYVLKAFDSKYGPFFFVDLDKFLEIRDLQNLERFVFGRVLTLGYAVADSQERIFGPQRWGHSFKLELVWAVLPACVIFLIIAPSLVLLYSSDVIKICDHSIAVTANQWYWSYSAINVSVSTFYNSYLFFVENSADTFAEFRSASSVIPFCENKRTIVFWTLDEFDSYLLSDTDLELGLKRLLDTDRHLVTPAFSALRFVVTSVDVLHSFALPSVGIKVDAVTGRLNMVSLLIAKDGLITGQCSELCGSSHYAMPIVLEAMYPFDFRSYLEDLYWESLELEGNCPLLSLDDTDDLDFGKTKVKEDLSFKYQPFLFKKNIV
jgi:cytochrome c oxidase subunit 2